MIILSAKRLSLAILILASIFARLLLGKEFSLSSVKLMLLPIVVMNFRLFSCCKVFFAGISSLPAISDRLLTLSVLPFFQLIPLGLAIIRSAIVPLMPIVPGRLEGLSLVISAIIILAALLSSIGFDWISLLKLMPLWVKGSSENVLYEMPFYSGFAISTVEVLA